MAITAVSDFRTKIAPFKQRAAALERLSNIYRRYPSRVSQQREAVIRQAVEKLSTPISSPAFFIGGSLAFGQAVEKSDADIPLLVWEGEQPSNEAFLSVVAPHDWLLYALLDNDVAMMPELRDFLDSSSHFYGGLAVKNFYYKYWLCPLRLGFDCSPLVGRFESTEKGQRDILGHLPVVLESLDSRRGYWQESFGKYKTRLNQHPLFQAQETAKRQAVLSAIAAHERGFFGE